MNIASLRRGNLPPRVVADIGLVLGIVDYLVESLQLEYGNTADLAWALGYDEVDETKGMLEAYRRLRGLSPITPEAAR